MDGKRIVVEDRKDEKLGRLENQDTKLESERGAECKSAVWRLFRRQSESKKVASSK